MQAILLTIHILIALALVGVILMQRSEGGALGMGGGGGGGGFMSRRGQANLLTRTTAILATAFIGTSLTLAILAGRGGESDRLIEGLEGQPAGQEGPANAEQAEDYTPPAAPEERQPAGEEQPGADGAGTAGGDQGDQGGDAPSVPLSQ